jgi:hypothetical protein
LFFFYIVFVKGWEETVDTAVNYALRTVLARSKNLDLGSTSNTIGNSTTDIDISKLKKRIQTLCERLEKGGSLVSTDRSVSPDCMLDFYSSFLSKIFFFLE